MDEPSRPSTAALLGQQPGDVLADFCPSGRVPRIREDEPQRDRHDEPATILGDPFEWIGGLRPDISGQLVEVTQTVKCGRKQTPFVLRVRAR